MTLLQIFEIEREVTKNPPLPGLTVKRIPASNPDHIWLVLEWPEGTKSNRMKSMRFTITTTGNCRWGRRLKSLSEICALVLRGIRAAETIAPELG